MASKSTKSESVKSADSRYYSKTLSEKSKTTEASRSDGRSDIRKGFNLSYYSFELPINR